MEPLLIAEKVTKRYERDGVFGKKSSMHALTEVSLAIYSRTTVALVGRSGSGKSTLALCLASLEPVSSGKIWFAGMETTGLGEKQQRAIRLQIQMIFQDPASSLNPRMSALELIAEPLNIQCRFRKQEREDRACGLLERVGIPREKIRQGPQQFSGGQRQRIAIARALALEPQVLILDEALSALDCSVQAQVANLLLELQRSHDLTYLFITHDLAMASHLADYIAVMEGGRIVEVGATESVISAPKHEATRGLLLATPGFSNAARQLQVV